MGPRLVSGNDDARQREADEAHSKLNEGLKSCRAVVSNYRALLDKKPRRPPKIRDGKDGTG